MAFPFFFMIMRYFYEKPTVYCSHYATVEVSDSPYYRTHTLYLIEGRGVKVIQQHFDPKSKTFWWGAIDPWLVDDIFLNDNFIKWFRSYSDVEPYPMITVRKLMWALRMKPLPKEEWEVIF